MDEVEPDTKPASTTRHTTRKKPVLQFSSDDDDDDFEQTATKGAVFVIIDDVVIPVHWLPCHNTRFFLTDKGQAVHCV